MDNKDNMQGNGKNMIFFSVFLREVAKKICFLSGTGTNPHPPVS